MSYEPRLAIHPGEVLYDILESEGHSQAWLAERTGYSDKQISQIINKKALITPELSLRLERVLSASADFWNNLTTNYQSDLARLEERKRAQAESEQFSDQLKNMYDMLVKHNYIVRERESTIRIKQIWSFFGVSSVSDIKTVQSVAFRKSACLKQDPYAAAAWLRCGEIEAKRLEITTPFSRATIDTVITDIKEMIRNPPQNFFIRIQDILKNAGIALVAVGYFKNSQINGATRWDGSIPVIQLSDRGKCDDKIWFTLFHELGHVILHGKREQFITGKNTIVSAVEESEADKFASDTLIDPRAYKEFIGSLQRPVTREEILYFAEEQNITPSIVLGRLQHDNYVAYDCFSDLHRRLVAG